MQAAAVWFAYLMLNESVGACPRAAPPQRCQGPATGLTVARRAAAESYQSFPQDGAHHGGQRQDPFQVPCGR